MNNITLVGIDTGVKTGFAVSNNGTITDVSTETIITAQARIFELLDILGRDELVVCIEDARQRTWVAPNIGRERLQGIGSVKRDCGIWQEFCEYHNIRHLLIAPANIATKLPAKKFKQITGWDKRTSEHGRDAGMMIDKYYRLIGSRIIAMPELPKVRKDAV